MSSRHKHRLPKPVAAWRWVYDGRDLYGLLEQIPDGKWRATRISDGKDREVAVFATYATALAFINDGRQ
jgi:hypothetical protein